MCRVFEPFEKLTNFNPVVAKGLYRPLTVVLLFFFFTGTAGKSGRLRSAYGALSEYDYFRAKKIFTDVNRKAGDPYASYGLALIFSRSDNPFYNPDSANRYVNLSYARYMETRKPATFGSFNIDSVSILALAGHIASLSFDLVKKLNTVEAYDGFISRNYLAGRQMIDEMIQARDRLEFEQVKALNKSRSTILFMQTHPQSELYYEALQQRDRQIYEELTRDRKPASYIAFLEKHPRNAMTNMAYDQLFSIYRSKGDVKGLAHFVKSYPEAPQHLEAWKYLFSLSVKAYSYAELKNFLDEYPEFPLKNTILKELELNKLMLIPYRKYGFFGFIDETGQLKIPATYDDATAFSEGLAVVHRNDSAFFINKSGENIFGRSFAEAYPFRNGIAAVQDTAQTAGWHFINRLGQVISRGYEEISEISDGAYVVRSGGRYGAIDQFGKVLFEPRFAKLGDFRNGYAYFVENGKYGFVSKTGNASKAEYDWVSDFSPERLAVIRQKENYGLVHASSKKLLEPVYDLVLRSESGVCIVVKDGLYGFFSPEGCFVSQVSYDYQRGQLAEYYTDGSLFRLIRKGEQALMDANGHLLVGYGQYEELGLPQSGLMLVKKKKKYGFTDRKLNLQVPLKYTAAGPFRDSVAIVSLKGTNYLIDTRGNELFTTTGTIERLDGSYFLVTAEQKSVINLKGEVVAAGVAGIQNEGAKPLIITLSNGEVRLLE